MATIEGIILLPEVEAIETIVARIDDGLVGGGTPPVETVVKEI
jgi:hypothetical protein